MASLPKVLVVDDDENIISAFEDFFRRERWRMIAASTAQEAMDRLDEADIDLLITDIRLKRQSGVTLFIRMKAEHPGVPVIVITGYPESITVEDLKLLGAETLLQKPLELDKLRKAVRAALQHRGRNEEGTEKPRFS